MEKVNQKGQWGTQFGFLMATIGSAVGLGNLWGFPYKMGSHGGFAFLLIYLVLFITLGVAMMLTEMALGRKTGKGVIDAWGSLGSKYKFIGWLGWLSPFLILAFYTVLGGFCIKYAVANFGDIIHAGFGVGGQESKVFFGAFTSSMSQSWIYTVIFALLCLVVVAKGVSSGIEKVSTIVMPALFVMLVLVIIRACTMPGAEKGLAFMFKPDFSVFKGTGWIDVLASAGGQLFFSLSLAMGIIITYGSYLKKEESLQQNAIIVPFADTLVAVMAGMAIMPAVFASGLDPGVGPGLIFITLQTVFQAMGSFGPLFGTIFYLLVFIAAWTSAISLYEACGSTLMDWQIKKGQSPNRMKTYLILGALTIAEATLVAVDGLGANGLPQIFKQGCWLDSFDLLAEGIMMPLGAFLTAIVFGWTKPNYLDDEIESAGHKFTMKGFWLVSMRFIAPVMMLLILLGQISGFFHLGWFK